MISTQVSMRTTGLGTKKGSFDELTSILHDWANLGDGTVVRMKNFLAQSIAIRAKMIIRNSIPAGSPTSRKNPSRMVIASAPGQPPAEDLGKLMAGITFKKGGNKANIGSAYAMSLAPYSNQLEFGHINRVGTIVEPRPFFVPAMNAALAAGNYKFRKLFEEAMRSGKIHAGHAFTEFY